MLKKPIVIQVDGIIGVGKTTFLETLVIPELTKQGYRVNVIKEPVDEWSELLPLFYSNPKRYSYLFQTMAFHDRVMESQKAWESLKDVTDIFISERGVISDTFFMDTLYELGDVTKIEMDCYTKWWNMWEKVMPFKPSLCIYLTASIDNIMSRIKGRARPGEEGITKEYQLILEKHHNKYFFNTFNNKNVMCCAILMDDDYRNDQESKDCIVKKLLSNINSVV